MDLLLCYFEKKNRSSDRLCSFVKALLLSPARGEPSEQYLSLATKVKQQSKSTRARNGPDGIVLSSINLDDLLADHHAASILQAYVTQANNGVNFTYYTMRRIIYKPFFPVTPSIHYVNIQDLKNFRFSISLA